MTTKLKSAKDQVLLLIENDYDDGIMGSKEYLQKYDALYFAESGRDLLYYLNLINRVV